MPYQHLDLSNALDKRRKKLFENVDAYLHDVYGMFKLPGAVNNDGGGCNYSIAIVLLCVVDGLAKEYVRDTVNIDHRPRWNLKEFVLPMIWGTGKQNASENGKRFKEFVRTELWKDGKWGVSDNGKGAKFLYTQLRNPLVHGLAEDDGQAARKKSYREFPGEPVIGKWGKIPTQYQDIEYLDSCESWPDDWPALFCEERNGESTIKLCDAAFYWAVKRTAKRLIDTQPM